MKNIKILLGLLSVVLIMASCATTQSAMGDDMEDDPRTRQIGNRIYMQDPYYGTVVLERDPYTGRYYDVTNGPRYGGGYYGRYGNGAIYRGTPRGNYGRGGNVIVQQPSREREVPKNREETRRKVLGNN